MNRVYLKRATISSQVICFVNTSDADAKKLKEVPGGGGYWFLISTESTVARNATKFETIAMTIHVRKLFSLPRGGIK